ncbi:uncharacterized protein Tco025E_06148 [Trypanosoma conorhini]|uniref:Uncharacterized protein n=1 Tax=Trypanosoma conorhini TaxID=83891 RepID=A0A3R7P6N8_9TRYP|nr:uncharacterized protein Tco025E_06148 [Trypanosoma conorhini]RNF13600.1 hypothetical protein Tco025E_06148 [Trypanosoma conorhini]
MKYVCSHGSPRASQNGVATSTRAATPTCSATILALQRANAALTQDLEQCLDILRGARAFTDEVERVIAAVPVFAAFMQRRMQALMLLQHGVFLENTAVLFQLWHKDREAMLDAFGREAHRAYDSYQCKVEGIVEQHEAELEEVQSEWRATLETVQEEVAELTRRLQSAEEDEKREAGHALLKKAAALIERKRRGGCHRATQTSQGASAVACQTTDVYRRPVAVQTIEEESQWRAEPKRADEEEEKEPEPLAAAPMTFPAGDPGMSAAPREDLRQQAKHDAVEIDMLRRELQQCRMAYAHEQEAAVTARANCAVLEDTLHAQVQENSFLRDALDRIEAGVFPPPAPLASYDSVTLLERLALVGNAGRNPSPQVNTAALDTPLCEASVAPAKWTE